MSIDKSLVSKGKLTRERNVYSRDERIAILRRDGNWKEEDSVFGLRKVKVHHRLKRKGKKEKEEPKEETASKATETEGGSK